MTQIPPWIQEARKEIKRLNNHIGRLNKLITAGMVDEIDAQEDIMNWTGWRDGLKWCIKMWRGKTTREAVWAGEDGTDENEAFLKEKEKELKEAEALEPKRKKNCDGDCLSCGTEIYVNCEDRINPKVTNG